MGKLVQTLPLYFSSLIIALLIVTVHSQDKTSFSINNFITAANNLTFQGNAHIPTGSTFLRLTSAEPNRVGRVVYSKPIQFWASGKQSTFITTIQFEITPFGNNPGDGIAFFMAPVNTTIPNGATGGNLGIFDPTGRSPALFAVEFDTYVNRAWDPNYPHVGIDIISRVSRNVSKFEGLFRQVVTAQIAYEAHIRTISVIVVSDSDVSILSYVIDLKKVLHQQVQVGISASTGQEVSFHDVRSWHFTSTLESDNGARVEVENEDKIIQQYV